MSLFGGLYVYIFLSLVKLLRLEFPESGNVVVEVGLELRRVRVIFNERE